MNHLRHVAEKLAKVAIVKTFQDKKFPLSQADHQHVSNMYWYNTVLANHYFEMHESGGLFNHHLVAATVARIELQNRFNDELLPYQPHPDFKIEHEFLKKHGYMNDKGVISLNGEQVGVLL